VYKRQEETLSMLGMTLSEAINMFLCQVSLTGGLPFDVRLPMPKEVIVRSRADLAQKLDEAETDVQNGNVSSAADVFGRVRGKYGL